MRKHFVLTALASLALAATVNPARAFTLGDLVVLRVGDGTQTRSFCYCSDLIEGIFRLMMSSHTEPVNIGIGEDITIAEFARVVAKVVGYAGAISFDPSRPDGMPRKLLDVSRLSELGWRARTSLEDGLQLAYQAYLNETKQAAE